MKIFFVISYSLLAFFSIGQELNPNLIRIVEKIEKTNSFYSNLTCRYFEYTEQCEYFDLLCLNSTAEELLTLLKHENSIIKGYASFALLNKNYNDLTEILSLFLQSKEQCMTRSGCVGMPTYLARSFYRQVIYQSRNVNLTEEDSIYYANQIQKMDSLVLYKDKSNLLLQIVLERSPQNPRHYERIKYLAFKKKNQDAIISLARYQREDDIENFKKLKKRAFPAIAEFPHEDFWNFVYSYSKTNTSEDFIRAVSAFKNLEAAKILTEMLEKIKKEEVYFLTEVLTENYCFEYSNLILKIWTHHQITNGKSIDHVIENVPYQSADAFVEGLLASEKYQILVFNSEYESKEQALPKILENIKETKPEMLLSICKKNIHTSSYSDLKSFLDIVQENQLTEASEDIVSKLHKVTSPYDTYHLVRVLLSITNSTNRQMIAQIVASKKFNWDQHNWKPSFKKLFDTYEIEFNF